MTDWYSRRAPGDEPGHSPISMRDWFGIAHRRIRRRSPLVSLRRTTGRSWAPLGVAVHLRAARAIPQLALARLLAQPRTPLVLRHRSTLATARSPIFTIQSSRAGRLPASSPSTPAPASPDSALHSEGGGPTLEPPEAAPTSSSFVFSVAGAVRRLLARPRKLFSGTRPGMPDADAPAPARATPEERPDGAAIESDSEALGEGMRGEEGAPAESEPESEREMPAEIGDALLTRALWSPSEHDVEDAIPLAAEAEAKETRPPSAEALRSPDDRKARSQTAERRLTTPPLPLISRLIGRRGRARREEQPTEPLPAATVIAETGASNDYSATPPSEQRELSPKEGTSGLTASGEGTLVSSEGVAGESASFPSPAVPDVRRQQARGEEPLIGPSGQDEIVPSEMKPLAPPQPIPARSETSAGPAGLLMSLRRLVRREPPPSPALPGVQRQPTELERSLEAPSGRDDVARSEVEPVAPPPPTLARPETSAGPAGLLLSLRRLVRREPPPSPALPGVQRQPTELERSLEAPSGRDDVARSEVEPVAPPPTLARPETGTGPAAPRPNGLLLTLRRLVTREPSRSAASPPLDIAPAAAEATQPEPRPPASQLGPPLDVGPLVTGIRGPISRSGKLQVGAWAPVYRSLAVRQAHFEGGGGGETAWTGATPEHEGLAHPPAMAARFGRTREGRAAPTPAADLEAEEAYALARQEAGVVAIQRAAAAVGGASPVTEEGGPGKEEGAGRTGAIEKLAHEVYRLLRRRLQVEGERAGLGCPWL